MCRLDLMGSLKLLGATAQNTTKKKQKVESADKKDIREKCGRAKKSVDSLVQTMASLVKRERKFIHSEASR